MTKEMTIWDKFVDLALMTYYTTKHATIEIIPFLLIYSAYNLILTNKFNKIQIATSHSKKIINIKSYYRIIELSKENTTIVSDLL